MSPNSSNVTLMPQGLEMFFQVHSLANNLFDNLLLLLIISHVFYVILHLYRVKKNSP